MRPAVKLGGNYVKPACSLTRAAQLREDQSKLNFHNNLEVTSFRKIWKCCTDWNIGSALQIMPESRSWWVSLRDMAIRSSAFLNNKPAALHLIKYQIEHIHRTPPPPPHTHTPKQAYSFNIRSVEVDPKHPRAPWLYSCSSACSNTDWTDKWAKLHHTPPRPCLWFYLSQVTVCVFLSLHTGQVLLLYQNVDAFLKGKTKREKVSSLTQDSGVLWGLYGFSQDIF